MEVDPVEAIVTEYDFNNSEMIWNTKNISEKIGIWFQQQWGDMKYTNVEWCDIDKMQLRWASRWAESEKAKRTSQWGDMYDIFF